MPLGESITMNLQPGWCSFLSAEGMWHGIKLYNIDNLQPIAKPHLREIACFQSFLHVYLWGEFPINKQKRFFLVLPFTGNSEFIMWHGTGRGNIWVVMHAAWHFYVKMIISVIVFQALFLEQPHWESFRDYVGYLSFFFHLPIPVWTLQLDQAVPVSWAGIL